MLSSSLFKPAPDEDEDIFDGFDFNHFPYLLVENRLLDWLVTRKLNGVQ